jgi:hypothetical protein
MPAQVQQCWVDEHGKVYLACDVGFGLVQSQDVSWAAENLEKGLWVAQDCQSADMPAQFGYVASPQAWSLQHKA